MSTYEISKSSLLSLKAEILKKQEDINKSKLENKTFVPSNHGRKAHKVAKNKGVDDRSEKDYEEDPDLLRKSRQMLEAKSKLYDKLSNKQSSFENNKHYLVNFNQKSSKPNKILDECPNFDDDPVDYDVYKAKNDINIEEINESYEDDNVDSDDEWTEYTDSLGRTRTCLKKDLGYMKSKDASIIGESRKNDNELPKEEREEHISEDRNESDAKYEEFNEKSELLSTDMKRELLRQQWEKEEATLAQKDDVHYQDVLFNEARTHGVGYFAFSKDETERAKQQAELEKLRKETTQKQKEAQDLKKTREKLLKNRIRAAQNRKRARLGLPALNESDEEEEKPQEPAVEPATVKEMTEEEKELELKRQQHIRPWDIGKDGVETPKEHYIYSQEEWVAKKRDERVQEFAPPRIDDINNRKYKEKRFNNSENSRNNKKLRTESPVTIRNPYKSKELPQQSSSSTDSSSDDENEDRLLQAYRQTEVVKPTKISFKVVPKTRSNPIGSASALSSSNAPADSSSYTHDSNVMGKSITPSSSNAPADSSSLAPDTNVIGKPFTPSSSNTSVSSSSFTPDRNVMGNSFIPSSSNAPADSSSFVPDTNVIATSFTPSSSNAPVDSSSFTPYTHVNSFTPVPIVNELLYSPTQSTDGSSSDDGSDSDNNEPGSANTHNQYAAIAPPATFDYYGPRVGSKSKGRENKGGTSMADSIMMGLKYLREQAERKGKLNRGNDDI